MESIATARDRVSVAARKVEEFENEVRRLGVATPSPEPEEDSLERLIDQRRRKQEGERASRRVVESEE